MPASRKKPRTSQGNFGRGELRDLPDKTPEEWRKDREDAFARAWAQKAAREAAEARGEIFVPEWQKKAAAKKAAEKAAAKAAFKPEQSSPEQLSYANKQVMVDKSIVLYPRTVGAAQPPANKKAKAAALPPPAAAPKRKITQAAEDSDGD